MAWDTCFPMLRFSYLTVALFKGALDHRYDARYDPCDLCTIPAHANFGVNKVNSLGAMAASVKHEYYANFTICCHLNY